MATVNIHIYEDLVDIFRREIEEIGYSTAAITDSHDLMTMYFTLRKKLISKRSRKVLYADDFACSTDLQAGLDLLVQKFEAGQDVNPHLSRTMKKMEFPDFMLFDWGIHHFHLGTQQEADGYMSRTGNILYAYVSNDEVRFVKILPHNHWSDLELIETIHRNWPEIISMFKVDGTPEKIFNSDEIASLRKAHINCMISTSDGTSYLGMGMGMMLNGCSALASQEAIHKIHESKRIQEQIIKELNDIERILGRRDMKFNIGVVRETGGIYAVDKANCVRGILYDFDSIKNVCGL